MSATARRPSPTCCRCGLMPTMMYEYLAAAKEAGYRDVDAYVREQEGTYNEKVDRFACTPCYAALGAPTIRGGRWVAP